MILVMCAILEKTVLENKVVMYRVNLRSQSSHGYVEKQHQSSSISLSVHTQFTCYLA